MLSFIQLNLHKAEQATILLGQEMEGHKQLVSLITEPKTVAGRITGMPRGTNIISDKTIKADQPGPRAGIIASRSLQAQALDAWCTRDCAVASVKLHGRPVLQASVYFDITKPATPEWLENLLHMANNKNLPIILGIDSNAHSSLYGPDNNARGDAFEELVISHGLEVHNRGTRPTFETKRGHILIQTHIDVTLTRDIHFDITNWRVDDAYNASDHNTIRFEASATPVEETLIRPWSSADWVAFSRELTTADYKIPLAMSMKKLDKLTDRMYTILQGCLLYTSPSPRDRQKSRMPSSA